MKSRKRKINLIKNYSDQERRPSRKMLETLKAMISDSDPVLKSHTYWYGDAIKQFELLKKAFADVEKLAIDAELARAHFVRSKKQEEDYQHFREQANVIKQSMADIRSGKTLRLYQDDVLRIGNELNKAHRAQTEVVKKQNAEEIYKRLNTERALNANLLEQAKKRLDELEQVLEKLTAGCCTPTRKTNEARTQVENQKKVIEQLELTSNANIQKIMKETVNQPAPVAESSKELADLQKRFDSARNNARFCEEHQDSILAQKQSELDAINVDKSKAVKAINTAALRHYANLDTQVMHGIIRVYAYVNSYKTAFDFAVNKYIKKKDEASSYSQQLSDGKAKIDTLMGQLWCENFRQLSGLEIYAQFSALPQQSKDKLLALKPDTTALAQIIGAAQENTAKASAAGLFAKKPVAVETAAKRSHLKKEARVHF